MPIGYNILLRSTASPRRVPNPRPAPAPSGPNPPSNLAATAIGPNQIDLTWTSNSGSDTTFHVRRGLGAGPGETDPLADVPNNGTSYSDFTVEPSTQYFYTVWASNPSGASSIDGPATATTPSEGTTLQPDFYQPAGSLIEEQSYDLRARVLNPDNTVHTAYAPADWTFSITVGGTFGSIGGANNDVLSLNASTAGNSITVRASYVGSETLDPTFEDVQFSIVVQPSGNFPVILEPVDHTEVMSLDGSSLSLPTLQLGGVWSNTSWFQSSRFDLVSDVESKFGSTLEKRAFVGDTPGHGAGWATTPNAMSFQEAYFRMVFKRSDNFQRHPGGDKFFYFGHKFPGVAPRSIVIGSQSTRIMIVNDAEISAGFGSTVSGTNAAGVSRSEGDFVISNGSYHTLEFLLRMNTEGMHDGFARCAFNGVEVATWEHQSGTTGNVLSSGVMWKNSNYFEGGNGKLQGWQMFYFWGGSGGEKEVNDYTRISELYVSGKN